jgi:hypothetical protein
MRWTPPLAPHGVCVRRLRLRLEALAIVMQCKCVGVTGLGEHSSEAHGALCPVAVVEEDTESARWRCGQGAMCPADAVG